MPQASWYAPPAKSFLKVTRKSEPCRVQALRVLGKKIPAVIFPPKKRAGSAFPSWGKAWDLAGEAERWRIIRTRTGKPYSVRFPKNLGAFPILSHSHKSLFPVFIFPKKAGTKAARLTLLHNTVSLLAGVLPLAFPLRPLSCPPLFFRAFPAFSPLRFALAGVTWCHPTKRIDNYLYISILNRLSLYICIDKRFY